MTRPTLDAVAELLQRSGYRVAQERISHPAEDGSDADQAATDVLLAEQPLLVVGVAVAMRWSDIAGVADGLVVAIADLVAERDPSPRQWDLTVPLLLSERLTVDDMPAAGTWGADTRYARRFIVDDAISIELEQALAPILPLELEEREGTAGGLLRRLSPHLARDLGDELASTVLDSFERNGEVRLP